MLSDPKGHCRAFIMELALALYLAHTLSRNNFRIWRCGVALRFQNKGDDVDREVEESKPGLGCLFLGVVLIGAFWFAWDVFIRGDQIDFAFRIDAMGCALIIFLGFILERRVIPKYREFRIRIKEILGTVTEIEETVTALKADRSELLERLSAIEEKLDLIRED